MNADRQRIEIAVSDFFRLPDHRITRFPIGVHPRKSAVSLAFQFWRFLAIIAILAISFPSFVSFVFTFWFSPCLCVSDGGFLAILAILAIPGRRM
ncbi:MAG: hypothetical protein ACRD72_11775 [Candidatus Angelobacter sp.]